MVIVATLLLTALAVWVLLLLELAMLGTYELARDALAAWWIWTQREWWRWWRRREVWIVVLLGLSVSPAQGCTVPAELRARSALDALADVVNPAWHLAEEACLARQEVVSAREKAGLTPPAQTDAELSTIRAQCDAVTASFDAIRAAHEEARKFVNAGEVKKAEALIGDIRARWRGLGETRP